MTPHWENTILVYDPSSPSRTLEGLFELTRCPPRALALPLELPPELQRNKDTVGSAALNAEVLGHRQQSASDVNLNCGFVENALFYTDR